MWQKNVGVVMALAAFLSPVAWADEKAQSAERETSRNEQREEVREQVYGYQLMTPAERDAYRERMRAARTVEEREQLRLEHHARMQARAKEQGGPAGYADDAGPGHGRRCRDGAWRWHGARSSVVAEGAAHGGTPCTRCPGLSCAGGAQGSQVLRIFSRLPFSAVKCTHWST